MKFAGSEGRDTRRRAGSARQEEEEARSDGLIEGGAVGVVARLRLEPSNSLKFKIACSHARCRWLAGLVGVVAVATDAVAADAGSALPRRLLLWAWDAVRGAWVPTVCCYYDDPSRLGLSAPIGA